MNYHEIKNKTSEEESKKRILENINEQEELTFKKFIQIFSNFERRRIIFLTLNLNFLVLILTFIFQRLYLK